MDKFTAAYIEAALWSSTDDADRPLDSLDNELSPETRAEMVSDCTRFQAEQAKWGSVLIWILLGILGLGSIIPPVSLFNPFCIGQIRFFAAEHSTHETCHRPEVFEFLGKLHPESLVLDKAIKMKHSFAVVKIVSKNPKRSWQQIRLIQGDSHRVRAGIDIFLRKIKRIQVVFLRALFPIGPYDKFAAGSLYKSPRLTEISYFDTGHQIPKLGVWVLNLNSFGLDGYSSTPFLFHQLKLSLGKTQTSIGRICEFCGSVSGSARLASLFRESKKGQQDGPSSDPIGPTKDSVPRWQVPCGVLCAFIAIVITLQWGDRPIVELMAFLLILVAGFLILTGYVNSSPEDDSNGEDILPREYLFQHNPKIVQQKPLTGEHCCYTVIARGSDMANVLNTDKQIAVIGALAEGSSIRSIERITGIHRDTIMRLGVKVGQGCTAMMDHKYSLCLVARRWRSRKPASRHSAAH